MQTSINTAKTSMFTYKKDQFHQDTLL